MVKSLIIYALVSLTILITLVGTSAADTYSDRGLYPAACIVNYTDMTKLSDVAEALERNGVRALQMFPPNAIVGHFPAHVNASVLEGMHVELVTSPEDIRLKSLKPIVRGAVRALMREEEIFRAAIADGVRLEPFEDLVLEVPDEIKRQWKYEGPRMGSPAEIMERGIDQNTEFLIGTVLVNIIFPESDDGSEDWTDEELANASAEISLGLSQYQLHTLWLDPLSLTFIQQHYERVPVTIEPIEGDFSTDPIWIADALQQIDPSYPIDNFLGTHTHNNTTREAYEQDHGVKVDWVFTAYVADASATPDSCWQGPYGGYAAYAYLGGPYIVCCYPPCGFAHHGFGFTHIFMHEMGHMFWALDEYESAQITCSESSGYMNVPNRNTRYNPCQALVDCIMNNAELETPIPICDYTLGQVGIWDENENSIPDVYEIPPEWESLEIQEVPDDTVYVDTCVVTAVVSNSAVPNNNPDQSPTGRIDYAPWLVGGAYWVGAGSKTAIIPSDSVWDESVEELEFTVSGLMHGGNTIYFEVENCAGLKTQTSADIHAIATLLQSYSTNIDHGVVEIKWKLFECSDNVQFFVLRRDKSKDEFVELPSHSIHKEGMTFTYYDGSCILGLSYIYRVEIEDESGRYILFETDPITVPQLPLTLFQNYPNPFNPVTSIRYYLPERSEVKLSIYDVSGKLVRSLENKEQEKGFHTIEWNGWDHQGSSVGSGVYICKLQAGKTTISMKMVLIR